MKIEIIDLLKDSKIYIDSQNAKIPLECKFVLATIDETLHLVLGPLRQFPYHAKLVEHFSSNKKIQGYWDNKPDLYKILTKEVSMHGGGWFRFDFIANSIFAYSISTAYGRFDETLLKNFVKSEYFYPKFTKTIVE